MNKIYWISVQISRFGSVIAILGGCIYKEPFYIIIGILGIISWQLHKHAMGKKLSEDVEDILDCIQTEEKYKSKGIKAFTPPRRYKHET